MASIEPSEEVSMIPNHVLVLGGPSSGKIRVTKLALPSADLRFEKPSHSGLIVKDTLTTKYFKTKLTILVDEFDERNNETTDDIKCMQFKEWAEEFMSSECEELRAVLKGMILTFNLHTDSVKYIEQCHAVIGDIRDKLDESGSGWDGFMVSCVVNGKDDKLESVEDLVISQGLEMINLDTSGTNEYREKVGIDRMVEIFETQQWQGIELITQENDYTKLKHEKLREMTKGLLEADSDEEPEDRSIDFTQLYHKIGNAKTVASGLNDSQKDEYVQGVIEDIINYI